jgi:hypothetical protein
VALFFGLVGPDTYTYLLGFLGFLFLFGVGRFLGTGAQSIRCFGITLATNYVSFGFTIVTTQVDFLYPV